MPNTISVLNPANWRPIVQDFLNNILVATDICNTQFREELVDGDTVNFPQMSDVYVQDYAQGTDLTTEALNAAQSQLLINKSKAVAIPIDPVQERQAKAKFALTMAKQSAFRLANNIDKDVLSEGVSNAYTTITGGALSVSNIFTTFTAARSALFRQNATDAELFAVIDTERHALIAQSLVANGFVMADSSLAHQYMGDFQGFRIYTSNNLPSTVSLTIDTVPTAGDTMTIYGVVWTWRAAGTAALAGEISITNGNLGACQASLLEAVNGTGTPGAANYIEISADNRTLLKNNNVSGATFGANVSVITAVGKINASETYTAATNVFGTESTNLLFGRMGAVSLGMQMMPNLYVREEPKQLARNYITHTLYGVKAFSRDTRRLVKVTCNA